MIDETEWRYPVPSEFIITFAQKRSRVTMEIRITNQERKPVSKDS